MSKFSIHWVPIAPDDLKQVAGLLRTADVFTPTFQAPEEDTYDPAVYLEERSQRQTATVLRIDRNVLTRVLSLLGGCIPTEQHRLAAGVLAFAQCADIGIEPNMALYELADTQGHATALEELRAFRVADDVHPGWWADIALGREDRIGERPVHVNPGRHDDAVDFAMPLRRWRRNYVLCLKLAELELRGGSAVARLRQFLRWSYEDFILGGPAIALAAHFLAPNATRNRLLKGLRSADRERALSGIRNAAWDVTLVSEWLVDVEKQDDENRLVLLTSFDAGVHRLARSLTGAGVTAASDDDALRATLCALWGAVKGARLAAEILELYGSRESPHRRINSETGTLDDLIAVGEHAIRSWRP